MVSEQELLKKIYAIFKEFPDGIRYNYKEEEDSDDPALDRLNVCRITYKNTYIDMYIDVPMDSYRFHFQIDALIGKKRTSKIVVFLIDKNNGDKEIQQLVDFCFNRGIDYLAKNEHINEMDTFLTLFCKDLVKYMGIKKYEIM